MVTKSCSFLLPILGYNYGQLVNMGLTGVYTLTEGINPSEGGKYIVLPFKKSIVKDSGNDGFTIIRQLSEHPRLTKKFADDACRIFVLKLSDEEYHTIGLPFVKGQYSKIDRDYVKNNFSEFTSSGPSINWQILNRDEQLGKYWSDTIYGVDNRRRLPEEAEVWSSPLAEEETYILYQDPTNIKHVDSEEFAGVV